MAQQQNKPTVLKNQKPVWIKCRASEACDGNEAIPTMVFTKPITQGGGRTTRYRCTTCKGVFTITL
jgi:hypothetical protein